MPKEEQSQPSQPQSLTAGALQRLEPSQDETDSTYSYEDAASTTTSATSGAIKQRRINGRTFHADSEAIYWGTNDARQGVTQDLIHRAYTLLIDGKLTLAPLPKKIETVIDIGTGTGSWAVDFALAHPKTRVIGTDLSPVNPPHIPPNLSFQNDDFTLPWTFKEASVDFIHCRWLAGSVIDWTWHFENALRVLKPGGWIETYEVDADMHSDDSTLTDDLAMAQFGSIFSSGAAAMNTGATFNPVYDEVQRQGLEDAGFVNLTKKDYKIPVSGWSPDPKLKKCGELVCESFLNDVEGLCTLVATQLGWTKDDIHEYCHHFKEEMIGLEVHAYYTIRIYCAQKPLE